MKRIEIGVVVLAVLSLLDALSPWLLPAPPDAPPVADLLSVVFGVVSLALLGLWWARRHPGPLWGAVVLRAISALLGALGLLDATSVGFAVALVVVFVATVVGIVLAAPALSSRSRVRAAGA